ncbi:unnamed protein product [Phytophthora lilii]|uniref:Unnamed protein product n=1 Tax=Phytophthora lilii TaxID=2077276 RepID=A0A9W6TR26_9STRA|nr:unnamed protein product [Phytophthora lilii]
MLDLSATLSELADFSSLWFRELYLELAHSVQIPVEISLPWLLIEHCLDGATSRVEPVLSILDVYNDAANCSLLGLQKQCLYDETEAEGKLCFDHFIFLLAERVYLHYKSLAAREACRDWSHHCVTHNAGMSIKSVIFKQNPALSPLSEALDDEDEGSKYETIFTQRHVSILGQGYDLALLLGQRIDALLCKDLEGWFTKFEASDATCYVAMLDVLKILKTTYSSLSALGLDECDDVIRETNDETLDCLLGHLISIDGSTRSRVHDQISQTVLTDLCQHFCVKFDDRRFIRMQLHDALTMTVGDQFAHEECLRKAKQYRLSRASIFRGKVGNSIAVEAAKYGVLEKAIMDELEAQIFHCFREIGNALMLLLMLGHVIVSECVGLIKFELVLTMRYKMYFPNGQRSNTIQLEATQQSNLLDDVSESQPNFLQCALGRIAYMLETTGIAGEWEAAPDSQPEKMPNSSSFYHVWCALEFLSCNRPRTGDSSTDDDATLSLRDMFGDGVQFAGCTLVHLLGQRTLYELWNVSQHVINVHHHEKVKAASDAQIALVSSSKKGRQKFESLSVQTTVGTLDRDMAIKAARFIESAREMRSTTARIFHTLELAWPSDSTTPATFAPPQFTPPVKAPSSPLAASMQYHR